MVEIALTSIQGAVLIMELEYLLEDLETPFLYLLQRHAKWSFVSQ